MKSVNNFLITFYNLTCCETYWDFIFMGVVINQMHN